MNFLKSKGTAVFGIIYNMLGLLCLSACYRGLRAWDDSQQWFIGGVNVTLTIVIILTVLFFLSSFLLTSRKVAGYLIPIFLLTFFISGGFVLLVPVLAFHILFFTHPQVNAQFT